MTKEPSVEYKKLGSEQKARPRTCTKRVCLFTTLIIFLGLCAFIFLFIGIGASSYFPLHASCSVRWTLTARCSDVKSRVVKQINAWTNADNCKNGGEKCLYKLLSETANKIEATHETPKKHYVDDLKFVFTQTDKTCSVQGSSSSQTWYALLDQGTNYCNLHNLITGAGLDKMADYNEETSNKICTQYSSADCEVY